MQTFDVYVWLLRWLGHEVRLPSSLSPTGGGWVTPGSQLSPPQRRPLNRLKNQDPGLRLLVLIVLGLLANPLLPTKQKFDPSRKAICLVPPLPPSLAFYSCFFFTTCSLISIIYANELINELIGAGHAEPRV